MASSAAPGERVLVLLQLDKVAIADQLAHVVGTFRAAQVAQLVALLEALESKQGLEHVAAYFDRKLDVKTEMERYLHDLLQMHHYITRHGVDRDLTDRMMQLYGTFGDSEDRHALAKVFQTLGFALASVFCALCETLSPKHQQELLTLFADDLPELRVWIQWLSSVRSRDTKRGSAGSDARESNLDARTTPPAFDDVLELMAKTVLERCTLSWLALLRPLPHALRVAITQEVNQHLPSTSLKQLTRFFETSGMPMQLYLELDAAVRRAMPTLLNEFPAASLRTLFQRFNSAKRIECVLRGRTLLSKRELLRLVDALGLADTDAIDVFVPALVQYSRFGTFSHLFLTFAAQQQLHFLRFLCDVSRTASPLPSSKDAVDGDTPPATIAADDGDGDGDGDGHGDDRDRDSSAASSMSEHGAAWRVFDLFLDAHFHSYDAVIQKLAALSSGCAREMVASSAHYSPQELATLGDGIEHVASSCLQPFLSIFAALPLASRAMLVEWVREIPGDDALPVYDVLLSHLTRTTDECDAQEGAGVAAKVLGLVSALALRDKRALCTAVLVRAPPLLDHQQLLDAASVAAMRDARASALAQNDRILQYMCACTMALHKAVKLFRSIPAAQYDSLIFLLRTQRVPEQVALTRLMLSLPSDANCRLLAKVQALIATETLDLFFELLLLIPQVEYRSFAKLLISPNVSSEQLQRFVQVAASLMNQASSRELVIFTADLPVVSRNLFFDMLAHDPVKGVLLRIVACSSKLAPELLHALIALLHPLSWGTRSSLVEQIRALESSHDTQDVLDVARELTPEDLEILVLLFNVLQVPVRIFFASLFLPLAHQEKHLALVKLNALPKAQLQSFCATVCDPAHRVVGTAFFRVFGLLESPHQLALLALLEYESCWPLISLLADCVAQSPEPSLINGFAAALTLLSHESEFMLLRSVVEEALASDTSLHALVLVLCHFRSHAALLELLKYVQHLSRFTRSTVFFRVLSQYTHTAFLFAMCRMLDLDDALFALKRLDRLRPQHRDALERELDRLANRSATASVEVKDEFCNVVLGFHERSVSSAAPESAFAQQSAKARVIVPRTLHTASEAVGSTRPRTLSSLLEAHEDGSDRAFRDVLFIPSTRPASHPPLSLERHLRRVQSDDTFAQRLALAVASRPRESTSDAPGTAEGIAQCELAFASHDDSTATRAQTLTEPQLPDERSTLSSVFALTEAAPVLPSLVAATRGAPTVAHHSTNATVISGADHDSSNISVATTEFASCELCELHQSEVQERGLTTLPPLITQPPVLRPRLSDDERVRSRDCEPATSTSASAAQPQLLSRSESAPTTLVSPTALPLSLSPSQRARQYRGLAAALDIASNVHVVRDRGASIFRKECQVAADANRACRIRVSKSLTAQSHVMAVRVQHALGKRDVHASDATSPLLRPDRHTIEQATAALALAARARRVDLQSLCHSVT